MRKREQFFLVFFFFFFLSVVVFFAGKAGFLQGLEGITQSLFRPGQTAVFKASKKTQAQPGNMQLLKKLAQLQNLQKENAALKDQFQTTSPSPQTLLPAAIVGAPFVPGVSKPSYFVLSTGSADGVKIGQVVIYKDSVVGRITKVSQHLSVVTLITDRASSFTGLVGRDTLGVVKGQGESIIIDHILASETVHTGDVVTTKGDINMQGIGFPPNLVVGAIASIDKTQSSLFQMAKIKSPLDFENLTMVFILTE